MSNIYLSIVSRNSRIIRWELKSGLGLKECITEGDFICIFQEWICLVVGVYVEEDRHVDFLPRVESLLFKTEALDLVKVGPGFERNNIVG